jgi:hypothetical protein
MLSLHLFLGFFQWFNPEIFGKYVDNKEEISDTIIFIGDIGHIAKSISN